MNEVIKSEPVLVEARVEVDLDRGTLEARSVGLRVGIHGVDVVGGEVHDNDLGVTGFRAWRNIAVDEFGGDLSVVGLEVVAEARLIIVVGLNKLRYTFQNIPLVRGWLASRCQFESS